MAASPVQGVVHPVQQTINVSLPEVATAAELHATSRPYWLACTEKQWTRATELDGKIHAQVCQVVMSGFRVATGGSRYCTSTREVETFEAYTELTQMRALSLVAGLAAASAATISIGCIGSCSASRHSGRLLSFFPHSRR